jgi:hypothetical protein
LEFIFLDYYRHGEDAARDWQGWPPRILTPGKPLTTKGTKDHKGQPLLLLLEISCFSKLKILKLLMQRIFLAE